MRRVFDSIFELAFAYMQVMYLLAGSATSGAGLLLIGYAIYRRLKEHPLSGEVVAVRKDGADNGTYWPVVAYADAQGVRHEVMANSGSSDIGGRAPGTKVELLDSPIGPMLMRDWWSLMAIGLFLCAVGTPFLWVGLRHFRFNWATLVIVTGVVASGGYRLLRFVHRLVEERKSGVLAANREAFLQRKSFGAGS